MSESAGTAVCRAAPFRPSDGDFGGNLVYIEAVCVLLVKPIYGSKQIFSASLSQFALQ